MAAIENYYAILGVRTFIATPEEIADACMNKLSEAAESDVEVDKIQQAHSILCNADERKKYDQQLYFALASEKRGMAEEITDLQKWAKFLENANARKDEELKSKEKHKKRLIVSAGIVCVFMLVFFVFAPTIRLAVGTRTSKAVATSGTTIPETGSTTGTAAKSEEETTMQEDPTTWEYVKSISSKFIHHISCPSAKNILDENRVYYRTLEEALDEGCTLCSRCRGKP